MIWGVIANLSNIWYGSQESQVKSIVKYIEDANKLRAAQIDAIKIYLFLKIKCENKPLWRLIAEGAFCREYDLDSLQISHTLREKLKSDIALKGLFDLSREPLLNGKTLFLELESHIKEYPSDIDANSIIKSLFYGVDYTDYLFSLPMGAGKTYLMSAFMYLDMYFAINEPDNKIFAHNFLVMIPSGLKSSISPSLKTIFSFDPSWVLPEPSASNIKRMMKYEVLDESKSAKKSNRARNPNSAKVASYQPFETLMGLVLIVNAEKVILDKVEVGGLFEKMGDEKERRANELRELIGKIPNLQIYIDEVHHAATDDIKLRQVVNRWSAKGSINSVLGFSGTPYLSSPETIKISDTLKIKTTQISDTVFYYPLVKAIQKFLKQPIVEQAKGLEPIQIVESGIKDFLGRYKDKIYQNGACAKIAVYCGNIERLEEEIYPRLISIGLDQSEILKYHKGNAKHKPSKESEAEFLSLDTPLSKKKIILLVQIGKEGWDCRSLTGVILSQKGDCPSNMTLQTACRCLRQMDGGDEKAIIWLNEENAKTLDRQLKEEQHTSIAEINALSKMSSPSVVERLSRMGRLKLPEVDFFQMQIETSMQIIDNSSPKEKIESVQIGDFETTVQITTRTMNDDDLQSVRFEKRLRGEETSFGSWLFDISKESFGGVTTDMLLACKEPLSKLFGKITVEEDGKLYANDIYDHQALKTKIRLAFYPRRALKMIKEIIPCSAELLKLDKLSPVAEHDKLYPNKLDCKKIIELDISGGASWANEDEIKKAYAAMSEALASQGMGNFIQPFDTFAKQYEYSKAVKSKERTFHYLPYDFKESGFESSFLKETLSLEVFNDEALEIYYNGERDLTEFRIACYEKGAKGWRKAGKYTPDFLVLKREEGKIQKILIVETKGVGYASNPDFVKRREFTQSYFVPFNNQKYGYKRFEYLYIQDDDKEYLSKVEQKIIEFFKEGC